ncbi:1-phosphofructokinase [Lachnospiraceae bacterium]|nr:1-phosphofructokinase [Lachnospiraceae bacterium]
MIYTVTLNPSLDYVVSVGDFKERSLNRTDREVIMPGGKGINVSIVLKRFGVKSTALGFLAGFTGEEIRRRLKNEGVANDFIDLKGGCSRINVKVLANNGETEINGQGPSMSVKELDLLIDKIRDLPATDTLVLSGSIPASMPRDSYRRILDALSGGNGCRTVLDTGGAFLRELLPYRPFLIKPNKEELQELFRVKINGRDEALKYAKELQKAGARNVLVSLGGEGAVLVTETGEEYSMAAPEGNVVNTVGSGDSMVAGFLTGLSGDETNYHRAFLMGIAAGSASAFSMGTADRIRTEALLMGLREQEEKENE